MNTLHAAVIRRGKDLFRRMEEESAGRRSSHRVSDALMRWSMRNEALKTQLFRLVDTLPSLREQRAIGEHTRDYLANGNHVLPPLARLGVEIGSRIPFAAAAATRIGVGQMGRHFILAESPEEAIPLLRQMRESGIAFTVDILGETVLSEREADDYAAKYSRLIEVLAAEAESWPEDPRLDRAGPQAVPKVNISVKISALYSQIRPPAPEIACEKLAERLRPLLRTAKQKRVFVNFDMEHTGLKTLTIDLFLKLLSEPEFARWNQCGLVLQAYLKSAEEDCLRILHWAREQRRRPTIRLVKGAYWDTEVTLARQRGWPVPVFENKAETDANYEALSWFLLENRKYLRAAFATHNVRSIAYVLAAASEFGVSAEDLEFQVLYGMADPLKAALSSMGCRVRQYCPIGQLLPGMAYLVRRLLENTSNEGFLRTSVDHSKSEDELLEDPLAPSPTLPASPPASAPFTNEPLVDFTIEENRQAMRHALSKVRGMFGRRYPLEIGGRKQIAEHWIDSVNPACPAERIGSVPCAEIEHADRAIDAARHAWRNWAALSFAGRAGIIERVARKIQEKRFEFAALEVAEVGKPWLDADADVAEAIDFCRFYAQRARAMEAREYPVAGERNLHEYRPRGVGVVIAPWNFPLAILCGMTVAGLVTGNAVIIKPAEQSPITAAWFFETLRESGVPAGAVQFLPGRGEIVGARLCEHAGVDWIAFTGSREVGLKIWETAGRTRPGQRELKRVVCEMGGKNAMIIDDDADLDEAIPGILNSAFGYAGQKCSALSRLIVLDGIYDRLLERLVAAARDLPIGDPRDPQTVVGPLVDSQAQERVQRLVAEAKLRATVAFESVLLPTQQGCYLPPVIFTEVEPDAPIAREEVFGPVLCVFRARDLKGALALANDSEFRLTGGLYSRSPAHIALVRREFDVGNLYFNRPITGAQVGRHPFGGHGMSGGGTKAGGDDYLLNFVLPRAISENLMRHGFSGEEE